MADIKAIEMAIAKKLKYHCDETKYRYELGKSCFDICVADIAKDIEALQQMAEREKGCLCCESIKTSGLAFNTALEKPCLLGGNSTADGNQYIAPKFCFMCGKQLTDINVGNITPTT